MGIDELTKMALAVCFELAKLWDIWNSGMVVFVLWGTVGPMGVRQVMEYVKTYSLFCGPK